MEMTRRQKRIFHFFEDLGYSSFYSLLAAANNYRPDLPEDEALEAMYRDELAKQQTLASTQRVKFYEAAPEEINSILVNQWHLA